MTKVRKTRWRFFTQYLRHPVTVGAVMPTSRRLAAAMADVINFQKARCIVEYGPGAGVFTEQLLRRRYKGTKIVLIEKNKTFCDILRRRYGNERNLVILHDTAEEAVACLRGLHIDHVDYVVSELPFASLPETVTDRILRQTQQILGRRGRFVTLQYSLVKQPVFRGYFDIQRRSCTIRHLPPAFIFVMRNRRD